MTSREYTGLLQTAANVGIEVIPRRKAAKLLALCYVYGDEPFVFDQKLYIDTMMSAKMYGVQGGMNPNKELVSMFRRYCKELINNTADWKNEIGKEYGIEFLEYKDGGIRLPEGFDWKTRWGKPEAGS